MFQQDRNALARGSSVPTSGSRLMGNDDGMRVPGNLRFMGNNDGMRVRENLRIPQILNHDSNYISETVTEEAEASSSLSTRYRYRKPPSTFVSTQEGGVSNTTTSQDYTGSSEGMENAELNLVAKKYPDSGTEGIDVAAQNTAEQGPTSDLGTQDGLVSEEVNVSSGQLNGTGEPLLDDGVVNFDFASLMPQVGEGIDSLNSDMSGYVDSHRRERDTQLLPTTRTIVVDSRPQPHVSQYMSGESVTQSQAELSDKHEYENQLSRPAKKRRANPSRQVQRSSHGPKMTGFNGPNLESSEFEKLRDSTARLQEENTALRLQISASQTPAWTTLYRVDCGRKNNLTTYSAAPILCGDKNDGHFQGQTPAEDVEPFIARQKERLPFLVLQNYRCCGHKSDNNSGEGLNRTNRNMHLGSSRTVEEIYLLSKELCKALGEVTKLCPHGDNYYPSFEVGKLIKGPYFWYYHNRGELDRAALSLTVEGETEFRLFQKCISQNLGGEYDIVDSMLSRRKITTRFFNYLYNPGTVLLTEESDAIAAFMQDDWPETTAWEFELQEGKHHDIENELKIKAWHWSFDGVFQRTDTFLKIPFNANASADGYFDVDKEIDFTSLSSYPLAYAGRDVEKRLFERGTKFWSCRHRNYVAYNGGRYKTGQINTESRFMVDLATFYMMHPKKLPKCRLTDHLGPDATAREQPPGGNFLLLLPDKVHGFDMQEKQWVDLEVEHIVPVVWNKEAFRSLVANSNTKDLITARITNHLATENATDLISGKGTGLIILLHGGPGTGKTLTAESVAEIAEKPLYRVTCGDIETTSDAIEKYLETVLLLGKTWECVVLLDKADVFLEQRTLPGILILTSSRVGKFDKALKSRIQLALHYETLNQDQRRQIWKTFITKLEGFQKDTPIERELVNTEDLYDHLDELSDYKMNGWEISNAVTAARQLALFKKEKMNHSHLTLVIEETQKFEGYLL